MVNTLIVRQKARVQTPDRSGDVPKTCWKQSGIKYAIDIIMKPRQKQTMRVAALDSVLKCARGITGCFASFHCDTKKNTNRMMPRTMRQRTVADV